LLASELEALLDYKIPSPSGERELRAVQDVAVRLDEAVAVERLARALKEKSGRMQSIGRVVKGDVAAVGMGEEL
jgi:hypothetical protein